MCLKLLCPAETKQAAHASEWSCNNVLQHACKCDQNKVWVIGMRAQLAHHRENVPGVPGVPGVAHLPLVMCR